MRPRHTSYTLANPLAKMLLTTLTFVAAIVWLESANANELGRLFYTPQQRAQLETQQATGSAADDGKRNFIVVNGVIQKQGGNRIVWLNGEAQTPVRANNNPASIDVAVPGKTKHVQVKVGQRLLLDLAAPSPTQSSPMPDSDDD